LTAGAAVGSQLASVTELKGQRNIPRTARTGLAVAVGVITSEGNRDDGLGDLQDIVSQHRSTRVES